MVLNTCLSFLNKVMASEPFFEERSDAVKMSETPYPTNGSGKNLAEVAYFKCIFLVAIPYSLLILTYSFEFPFPLCLQFKHDGGVKLLCLWYGMILPLSL